MLNDYIIPGLRAVKQDIEALAPECEVGPNNILLTSRYIGHVGGLKNLKKKKIGHIGGRQLS